MIDKFIEINKKFDKGVLVNSSTLEFAISAANNTKNWQEQVAFVVRALVNDHVFSDGNKRTAAAFIMAVFEEKKLPYDPYKIEKLVLSVAKNKTKNIKTIKEMIRNALR